jgi:hypothetical protein
MRMNMTRKQPEAEGFDALGIAALAALIRIGDPYVSVLLQTLGILSGAAAVAAIAYDQVLWAIAATIVAWTTWWLGRRLHALIAERPLDQVQRELENPPNGSAQ